MRRWNSNQRHARPSLVQVGRGVRRSGLMIPAIAMALLVTGMAVLLVVDKLWLDTAEQELRTVAEAAALAAAGELASDNLLLIDSDSDLQRERALNAASSIAEGNAVLGSPIHLDTSVGGDVRIGRYVFDEQSGEMVLIETAEHPTHVVVTTGRTRGMNPMAPVADAIEGSSRDELAQSATATLNNAVTGVRALAGANVPAFPLAILEDDQTTGRVDTWRQQIEMRLGLDAYSYDADTNEVALGADGLPEIIVHAAPLDPDVEDQLLANVHLIDVGTGLYPEPIANQIRLGWSADDLVSFGGEFSLAQGPMPLDCDAVLAGEPAAALMEMIGTCRICVLYNSYTPGTGGLGQLHVTRLVAVRVMDVRELADGTVACVLQPGVVATRTAVAGEVIPLGGASSDPLISDGVTNPYIYRLFLTR